jgi:Flp pilus assembly protein, protease CpaA
MTSRSLFFKLQKEDLKRRIWTLALAILVFFLSFPVYNALMIGNYRDYSDDKAVYEVILNFMEPNPWIILVTVAGALICGLSSFYYLHSKKKVDLYHSLPIKREQQFAVNYINGILIYLVPYVLNLLLCILLFLIEGYMDGKLFRAALITLGMNTLFYFFLYTIVIIAVMLTGNFVVSCLGTGVFFCYGPMLALVKETYFNDFFHTYYSYGRSAVLTCFLSPLGSYIAAAQKINSGKSQGLFELLVKIFILTVLMIALALFLYKKRPSEAAGKAITHEYSKPVIKFFLILPLTLAGGMIFRDSSSGRSDGWYIFGLIFAFFLIYAIIEIIYNFDIRSAFRYRKQMLFCGGVIILAVCAFRFDWFSYDSYIPKEEKIETMGVAFGGLDQNLNYIDFDSLSYNYGNRISGQLDSMKLSDIKSAYELADYGIKNNIIDTNNSSNTDGDYDYNVKYKLKNGRTIYRTYHLNTSGAYDMVKKIYGDKGFKTAHYQINHIDESVIYSITAYNMVKNVTFSLDQSQKKEFLNIYKTELNQLTLDEMAAEQPIATLTFTYKKEGGDRYLNQDYYIYPSFTDTITYMKAHGFDSTKEVSMEDIDNIRVNNYSYTSKEEEAAASQNQVTVAKDSARESITMTYTDAQQMSQIYPNLILNDYYWNNRMLFQGVDEVDVTVTYRRDAYGNVSTSSYYFKKGSMPEFVKKDVSYTK